MMKRRDLGSEDMAKMQSREIERERKRPFGVVYIDYRGEVWRFGDFGFH